MSEHRPIAPPAVLSQKPRRTWRSWWLKQLQAWHWISAAMALVTMLMFAVTGITLNHAESIGAEPVVVERSATLLPAVLARLPADPPADAPLPPSVATAVARLVGVDPTGRSAEWSDGEVYVAMPRPGGDGWVSIDRNSGRVTTERTDRGWISYLNDLHKGRNAGTAWFWFIDVFAGACILFTITGLLLLQIHARHRRSTWPLVFAGLAAPVAIAILFIH